MVVCFEATPKKIGALAAVFVVGASLFGYGLHLSHVNAAPQQARLKAKADYIRWRLRQIYDGETDRNRVGCWTILERRTGGSKRRPRRREEVVSI